MTETLAPVSLASRRWAIPTIMKIRSATALPIDALEAQVQWIDHRISASGDALEAEQLWRERVDAMNTLVRLRYVESQPLAM